MLVIKHLEITTDYLLIDNVNLKIDRPTIVGISAPNGSGKSTLMRTIAGLRDEDTGSIVIQDGQTIVSTKVYKRQIFYFETSNWLNPYLSGMDYLVLFSDLWQSDSERIKRAVDYWELKSFIQKPIRTYSLGMKQKLLLALYEIVNANYWFLDEPTLGLDRVSVAKLKQFFLEKRNEGKALFFSAHESEDFFQICDQVYRIDSRQLVLESSEDIK